MDPITTAIVAAVANLSEPAIKDAYEGVKTLIMRKFGRDSRVTKAIAEVEDNPKSDARKSVLIEEVATAQTSSDAEVMAAVNALLDKLQQFEVPPGSVHVEAKGERSVAVGGTMANSTIRTGDANADRRRK